VREEALMLKKVAEILLAMARPIIVLPVPGGPKRSKPFAGALAPCKVAAKLQFRVLVVLRVKNIC